MALGAVDWEICSGCACGATALLESVAGLASLVLAPRTVLLGSAIGASATGSVVLKSAAATVFSGAVAGSAIGTLALVLSIASIVLLLANETGSSLNASVSGLAASVAVSANCKLLA